MATAVGHEDERRKPAKADAARTALMLVAAAVLVTAAACGGRGPALPAQPGAIRVGTPAAGPGAFPGMFNLGRTPSADEVQAWNLDVGPDGVGLPEGSGTAEQGAPVFARECSRCHGSSGKGVPGKSGALVVPYDPKGTWPPFPRTVGNYWPYATTIFDYVRRAMPPETPGALSNDQLYGLVAWVLFQNEIIGLRDVMNAETLPKVDMPARDRFVASSEAP